MADYNIFELRHSKNLLERAAYWTASYSWFLPPEDFADAQADTTKLLELAKSFDKLKGAWDNAKLEGQKKEREDDRRPDWHG